MATILTPRLTLRPARDEDLEAIHAILSDPRAMAYWSTPPHSSIDTTREWLDSMIAIPREEGEDFIVEHEGRVIGKAGFFRFPAIGYIFHPDAWGRGFAQEALRAVLDRAFSHHLLGEAIADVDPRNAGSLKLLKRLGFAETGYREKSWYIGGEWLDSVDLALSAAEWQAPGLNEDLRRSLLAMRAADLELREALARDGALFEGYHPEMRALHEANARALDDLVAKHGWPGKALAGGEAASAAWLVAQHAISLPPAQRRFLAALQDAARRGEAEAWQAATLEDRVRILEGREQLYGTQFDWDAEGKISPQPIEDESRVDERRRAVGLPPIADAIAAQRLGSSGEPRPEDWERRQAEAEEFARSVGWR